MPESTLAADKVEQAVSQALAAARGAGVHTRLLDDTDDFRQASELFGSLWGTGPANAHMPAELIRAVTYSGGYAAGAFDGGKLFGAVVGMLGREDGTDLFLHSHILGVRQDVQARSLGFALKQHQRAWALEHGLSKVTWTFDPLVRRNAYFNVQKLAVDIDRYHENFYGSISDDINAGDETDRVLATWTLDSPSVIEAATSRLPEPDIGALVDDGGVILLDRNERGRPIVARATGRTLLCAVPEDVIELRARDGEAALAWRRALRETLGAALADGYAVRGFARSGWYVLTR